MNINIVRSSLRLALSLVVCLAVINLLSGAAEKGGKPADFSFIQVSDTHIGFSDPKVNPDYEGTLAKVIAAINGLSPQPDFVVFTGDLTHTTDEAAERRARLAKFAAISRQLKVKDIRYLPGEHDAGLDSGEAYKAVLGDTYYSFKHKGINFIVIDNVSQPGSVVGADQLKWLAKETNKLGKNDRVMILTHRPLFDLYPQW
ncbi:MAG TPA: metallophosphoesterase, partial [Candidatus Sulfotelmatobacter sp.]|nr:metallophosphoesterase [Candidatus Sulfotelmatobacter sp.]